MPAVTPYVMVDDAEIFQKFLEDTFCATISEVHPLPLNPRRIMHAEAKIGDSSLYFADSGPDGGRCLQSPDEPVHVQLWVTVDDADTTYDRALAAGARPAQAVTAEAGGARSGGFVDPFGTLWWVSTPA